MGHWTLLSKKLLLDHKYRPIEGWRMRLPNGREREYAVSTSPEVVIVFGITDEKQILVTHQYYIAAQKKVASMVAGFTDKKSRAETAIAELREEAGCSATRWTYLGSSFRGKYATGEVHYYLAEGVMVSGPQELEESEDIDVAFVSLENFFTLLRSGELQDVFQVACAYRALDYLHLL